jgi:hypothetical protein
VDTLRGNLDTFEFRDIVRLVAASRKAGALRVFGALTGRIFFVDGAVVYATTRAEDGSVNDLRGRRTDVTFGERRSPEPPLALPDLLRHQIIDVLVRLMERPGGEFVFDEGVTTTALPAGRSLLSFEANEVLEQANDRIAEWREVRAIVPDPKTKYHLARELPPDNFEITLDSRSWAFLAAISDGVSVDTLTERFRIFELAATRKLAEFVRRGLIEPVPTKSSAGSFPQGAAAGFEPVPPKVEAPEAVAERPQAIAFGPQLVSAPTAAIPAETEGQITEVSFIADAPQENDGLPAIPETPAPPDIAEPGY